MILNRTIINKCSGMLHCIYVYIVIAVYSKHWKGSYVLGRISGYRFLEGERCNLCVDDM